MAEEDKDKENGSPLPRLRLGEVGYSGLQILGGQILEECKDELRWPKSVRTFKDMSRDGTISAGLALFERMMNRPEWVVKAPTGASDETKRRAEFIEQCMLDMDHSWRSFIKEVTSFYTYGFAINEKVYRRRLRKNGSKYNDGAIGIKSLPLRGQDTIYRWDFTEDGRHLKGVYQNVSLLTDRHRYISTAIEQPYIRREKFLLFRTNIHKDNPEGKSPLVNCWREWRIRQAIEESEAIGIARDMRGIPVLYMPSHYMAEDAPPHQRIVYEYYKNAIRNLHNNEQSGMILPNDTFEDGKTRMFDFSLLGVQGTRSYDTNSIIERYDNKIMMALFADVLRMGQNAVGSYSLADSKSNITAMAIEFELNNIKDVLNFDLIPQIFDLNGWSKEELPYFEYEKFKDEDLEIFSKAIQRMVSVGAVEVDRPLLNRVRGTLNVDPLPEDTPPQEDFIRNISNASEGMAKGSGNGTSDNVAGRDNSASNNEN